MIYWVITDTHFGHETIKEFCGRPDNFEGLLLNGLRGIRHEDILIHLGDAAFSKEKYWHQFIMDISHAHRKWFIRGNHDKRGDGWYLDRG